MKRLIRVKGANNNKIVYPNIPINTKNGNDNIYIMKG